MKQRLQTSDTFRTFGPLHPKAAELRKAKEPTLGYNWWFQLALGKALRDEGWAMAMESEAEYDSPSFAPKRTKRPRPSPLPPTTPADHGELWRATDVFSHWDGNRHKVYMKERGWCAECMAVGREAGTVTHKEAKMPPGSRTMWTRSSPRWRMSEKK